MSVLSKEIFTFVEVARWQSVRKAAERLNLSASALSRQLRILEKDLGVRLFVRHSNGVELTGAGEQLLRKARDMMALETDLRGEMSAAAGTEHLHIRLGLAECISAELTRRLHASFLNAGKRVRLDVVVGETDRLVDRLVEGHLDAAVAFNLPTDERFRVIDVFEIQVGLVCARGMIADPPPSIALADCLDWPLCLPAEDLSIQSRLMTEIHRQERSFRIAATSNSIATTCGLIRDGAGVGFMTALDVMAQPDADKLLFVPLKDRRLTEHVSFAIASGISLRGDLGAALLPVGKIMLGIANGLSGVSW